VGGLAGWAAGTAGDGQSRGTKVIRRKAGSKDKRLRALYDGERGLPFVATDKL
jgi:hypothetical protein